MFLWSYKKRSLGVVGLPPEISGTEVSTGDFVGLVGCYSGSRDPGGCTGVTGPSRRTENKLWFTSFEGSVCPSAGSFPD